MVGVGGGLNIGEGGTVKYGGGRFKKSREKGGNYKKSY